MNMNTTNLCNHLWAENKQCIFCGEFMAEYKNDTRQGEKMTINEIIEENFKGMFDKKSKRDRVAYAKLGAEHV